jgi:hypothetical protein
VFFEFLIDKLIVNKKDLVKAVMGQMESMPSLIRILLEDAILDEEMVYELLIKSIKENRTFFDVLKASGGVTEEDLLQLLQRQNNKSSSLGDLLVQLGAVERNTFDQALRDYSKVRSEVVVSGNENIDSAPAPAPPKEKEEKKEVFSPPAGISAAALESLKAVQGLDDSMLSELEVQVSETESQPETKEFSFEEEKVEEETTLNIVNSEVESIENSATFQEYIDFYSEDLQSDIFVTANRYRIKGKKRDLESLYEKLVKILSLVKLNDFSFQEKMLEQYESYMSQILNGIIEDPESWRTCPSEMFEIIWEFRKCIASGKSEGQLLSDSKMKELYLNNIKTVLSHLKRSA